LEASCLQPSRQMETLIFQDLRLCSILTFDCPSSFFKPLPTRWSQSYPTLSYPHLGFRHWFLRSLTDVIPISQTSILHWSSEFLHFTHTFTNLPSNYTLLHNFSTILCYTFTCL
jgi:hypothetical protein